MSSMCTTSGQIYVAHRSVVDEVSLATLNELRIISVGDGECLTLHIRKLKHQAILRRRTQILDKSVFN